MNVKCLLVNKTSKEGKSYVCLEIYLTDTIKKVMFLTPAEVELVKLTHK